MATFLKTPRRFFDPRSFPLMTRASFLWELRSAMSFPFTMACLESGVIGVIAQKTFHAGDFVVAAVTAAPMVANLTSFLWARLLAGHDRVHAVVFLQTMTIVCVAALALAPISPAGLWMLVGLVYLGRSCLAGLVTARTDVWRSNYPRALRASIVGRFAALISLLISLTAAVIGGVMDATDASGAVAFRSLFLGCAVASLGGAWAMSHVRWRGRAARLRDEQQVDRDESRRRFGASGMLEVLRTDAHYRAFMTAQFALGMSAMVGLAPFIIALDEELKLGYAWTLALTQVMPTLLVVVTIPLWAKLLNRVHIVQFRAWHSWLFVGANLLTALGLGLGSLPLLLAARVVLGTGYGGGRLAWNLGHHDFAPRRLATLYMGIHVTLTGVRGAIASFIGVLLYSGWRVEILGDAYHYAGMRHWLFALLALVSAGASLMFAQLRRRLRNEHLAENISEASHE